MPDGSWEDDDGSDSQMQRWMEMNRKKKKEQPLGIVLKPHPQQASFFPCIQELPVGVSRSYGTFVYDWMPGGKNRKHLPVYQKDHPRGYTPEEGFD